MCTFLCPMYASFVFKCGDVGWGCIQQHVSHIVTVCMNLSLCVQAGEVKNLEFLYGIIFLD